MKKYLIMALSVIFGLTACQSDKTYAPISTNIPSSIVPFYTNRPMSDIKIKKQPVKIGMLLPLTGKSEKIAEDLRNAGILAQFELAPENYELSFYDTKGTQDGAKEALNQALNDKMQMILGPLFAKEVSAIRSMAQKNDIPVISFTSDEDVLSEGIYSMALTIQNQTERIIRFACEKGAKRLAIMAPDDKAGDIAIDSAKKTASQCGMEVTKLSVYNPTFINFEPYVLSVLPENFVQIRKDKLAQKKRARLGLKEEEKQPTPTEELTVKEQLEFDALFIADDGNRLKSISALFGLYDVYPQDVLFLGLSTWNEPSLSNEGSLKGAYFPLLPASGYEKFSKNFKDTYGKKPSRLASLAYDAVALSAALTANGIPDLSVIHNPSGFLGTDGLLRFSQNGTAERLMEIHQIAGPKKFVRKEKASASFAIEDWKKEQMQDIRIINEYEADMPVYLPEETSMTTTAKSADLTSTDLPLSEPSINPVH